MSEDEVKEEDKREEFVAPETGNIEQEKPAERTRESEIKANIEFWKGLGIEIDEADVQKEIEALPEVEGFDGYLYMPQNVNLYELLDGLRKEIDVVGHGSYKRYFPENTTTKGSYALALRLDQEPDSDTLGENAKNVEGWEQTDYQFVSPIEYVVAQRRYISENGTPLDQRSATLIPGYKCIHEFDRIRFRSLYYKPLGYAGTPPEDPELKDFHLHMDQIGRDLTSDKGCGVRKKITKGIPTETLGKYHQEAEAAKTEK